MVSLIMYESDELEIIFDLNRGSSLVTYFISDGSMAPSESRITLQVLYQPEHLHHRRSGQKT
jgi:hypothetical protein